MKKIIAAIFVIAMVIFVSFIGISSMRNNMQLDPGDFGEVPTVEPVAVHN